MLLSCQSKNYKIQEMETISMKNPIQKGKKGSKTEGKYEVIKMQRQLQNKEAFAVAKASWPFGLLFLEEIFANQNLHQLIPVDLADHAAGIVVVGDVGGILGQQVSNDLVDGIVAFFGQGFVHTTENTAHILFIVAGYGELQGGFIRHGLSLLFFLINYGHYNRKISDCKVLNAEFFVNFCMKNAGRIYGPHKY